MENKTPSQNFETAKVHVNVLSYEEKINLQEWLDGQIRKEMAAHTQKVADAIPGKLDSLLNKASDVVGKTGNSLKDNFNSAFGSK